MKQVFHLCPLTDFPAVPSKEWFARFRSKYPCLHHPPSEALDVECESIGEDVSLSFVDGTGAVVIRNDLYEFLAPFLKEIVVSGTLSDPGGRVRADRRTLGTHKELCIRGQENSTRTICETCGEFLYYPMGKTYVLESDLGKESVYLSTLSGLVITDVAIVADLPRKILRGVDTERLPVKEFPKDGLPVDLEGK